MTEGVIFDLDGVLIDSEPLWRIAEKKVFKTVDIELTDDMCRQTIGLDNNSTVQYWFNYKPWNSKPKEQVAGEIIKELLDLVDKHGKPNNGIIPLLNFFSGLGIPMAVASSSEMKIIETVLEKIKLKNKFAAVCSSESEAYGKPHPAVYLKAAEMLNADPVRCIAFEDSFYGAIAAKAARMKVVLV
ncbi:MAG: hexitol phosphatase HxpB, partial [Bacteroidales bacterium]|nr:hexitol phosphatase HxpB [Bacteroidales bacterium]